MEIVTWQDIAAQVRPAEERLIERYRSELFQGESASPDRGYMTVETPWGPARSIFPGVAVTGIGRRSAWPETQMVLDVFWQTFPDRPVVAMRPIWPYGRWHEAEPPYDEFFDMHLVEGIHKYGVRWVRAQADGVVYMAWRNRADLDNPPAEGEPPDELLRARSELDALQALQAESG